MRTAAYHVSAANGRPSALQAGTTTMLAALVMFALPTGASANLWAVLVAVFPASTASALALACTGTVGGIAFLIAVAVRDREPLRPALTVAIVATLLSPAALAPPLWPALFAAAGLIAVPVRTRPIAANDNPAADERANNPFSLAA